VILVALPATQSAYTGERGERRALRTCASNLLLSPAKRAAHVLVALWTTSYHYALGGADDPLNLQWQTIADAKAKDREEAEGFRRNRGNGIPARSPC